MPVDIANVYEEWERSGSVEALREAERDQVIQFIGERVEVANDLATTNQGYEALARLIAAGMFLEEVVSARRDIVERLGKLIEKFKEAAKNVASAVDAARLTIGVRVPFGFSIDLSFDVPKQ